MATGRRLQGEGASLRFTLCFSEVQGMATDVDIAKWLLKGRVQKADPISSAPLSQTYMKVLQDTSLVQVHEVLENEPFVAVIDNEKFKGLQLTGTIIIRFVRSFSFL